MYPPSSEHPLVRELALVARRAEPDLVLKARYLGFRKEVMTAVCKRQAGLVARLVADEAARLADTVMTECRQWREAGDWEDHRAHLHQVRAAATAWLFLTTTGLELARSCDPPIEGTHVRRFDPPGGPD